MSSDAPRAAVNATEMKYGLSKSTTTITTKLNYRIADLCPLGRSMQKSTDLFSFDINRKPLDENASDSVRG